MGKALVVIVGLIVFGTLVRDSGATPCPNQQLVNVQAADDESKALVCAASSHALNILARYKLAPKRELYIEIIDKEINHLGYMAFGSYDVREDRIQLMSYRSIFENYANPTMYDEPFDLVHYSGAIAHEITHAVFHHNSSADAPGPAPQEYLAHAIQLASLPEDRRDNIVQALEVSAWQSGDAISDIYMALEPGKFAVKSYKHLMAETNPQTFIETLLNAKWFYVYIP